MDGWIFVHNLDPILFNLGPLRVGWYGLMWAVGFFCGYWLLIRAARKYPGPVPEQEVSTLITYIILGTVLGGRLGWVLFYGGMPYFISPWRILETWKGGMAFHGGIIGVVLALWLFGRRRKVSLFAICDFVGPAVPPALFFGRIGNFINGELYGKPTDGSWGVIFPGDPLGLPRHPSQLYEAVFEGLLLFVVLQLMQGRAKRTGIFPAVFLVFYGLARIGMEFVRLPDRDIGYLWKFVTMGQLLSLPMVLAGLAWIAFIYLRPPPGRDSTA